MTFKFHLSVQNGNIIYTREGNISSSPRCDTHLGETSIHQMIVTDGFRTKSFGRS